VNPIRQSAVFDFATRHQLPTASSNSFTSGALLYYGPNLTALQWRAGNFHVDRILRGARPGDLPVDGPTVFDLIVNRSSARALGLTIPAEFGAQVTRWVEGDPLQSPTE
jgi:putative ABC transport system substrate-binding protein